MSNPNFYNIETVIGNHVVPGDGFYTTEDGSLVVFVGDIITSKTGPEQWLGIQVVNSSDILPPNPRHAAVAEAVEEMVTPAARNAMPPVVEHDEQLGNLTPEQQTQADFNGVLRLPPSQSIPVVTDTTTIETGFEPVGVPADEKGS